jgi:lipase maturation factor 1
MSTIQERRTQFSLTAWLFVRLLGLIYLFAFLSALVQMPGLVGESGILPAHDLLQALQSQVGMERYWVFPTLAWLNSSNLFLQAISLLGCLASLLVVAGIFTGPLLFLSWLLYLSIVTIGQDFYSFQWDILLLETGFLAIFLFPWRRFEPWLPGQFKRSDEYRPSICIYWLLRFLTFKLMFLSGFVKLASHDSNWASFSALDYHYFTQPLPNPIAYWANTLPHTFQRFSCGTVLFIELLVPFAIFMGREARLFAASALFALQILITLTGNYAFFNLLSLALCLTLLDDAIVESILPASLLNNLRRFTQPSPALPNKATLLRTAVVVVVAAFIAMSNLTLFIGRSIPGAAFTRELQNFYFANTYGLFAVMTTERKEIIVQGSDDGEHWLSYDFPFKPGPLDRAPPIVAPYQPRLDWQMWFAALGDYQSNPWFMHFMARLLEGSPDVLKLLSYNPFPDHPPKYLRAEFYRYTFTEPSELQKTGNWWKREFVEYYLPPIGVSDDSSSP